MHKFSQYENESMHGTLWVANKAPNQPTNQPTKHRLTLMILKPLMWKLFFNHKKMQDKGTIQLADPEKQYSCVF